MARAVEILESITDEDPHWAGAQVLLGRWKPVAKNSAKPAARPAPKSKDSKRGDGDADTR